MRTLTTPASDASEETASAVGIADAKRRMRTAAVARREQMTEEERKAGVRRVAGTGIAFAHPIPSAVVSAYLAIGAELDPLPLLRRLSDDGLHTCLPVLRPLGDPLQFRAWRPDQSLVERKWGIREPTPDAPLVEPDVLLVPLLAFDESCRRLGYGGGYYDRTLARLRSLKPIVAIGLAFDCQQVGSVPCGPHDAPLDWILTPTRVLSRPVSH
ncbi:MAG: 5-formyltetrahydrofolate cyclo-ligase [Hyphomicrobiaceae bacterium]